MIKKLDWDSKCFGYRVGKLEVEEPAVFNPEELPSLSSGYQLLYIFSKAELVKEFDGLVLVDKKTTLQRNVEQIYDECSFVRSYHGKLTKQILDIALQSGKHSRFKTDNAFVNDEFTKLYTEWIKKSVNRLIATEVYVYKESDEIQGIITINEKEPFSEIGLLAVDSKFRGMGIGSKLVKYATQQAYIAGCLKIQVVTQFDNKSAMDLYIKNGFEVTDISWIYHYRNK